MYADTMEQDIWVLVTFEWSNSTLNLAVQLLRPSSDSIILFQCSSNGGI